MHLLQTWAHNAGSSCSTTENTYSLKQVSASDVSNLDILLGALRRAGRGVDLSHNVIDIPAECTGAPVPTPMSNLREACSFNERRRASFASMSPKSSG